MRAAVLGVRQGGRPLLALALGHLTVDAYVGLIPVLYPLLIERFALNLSTVGLVTTAYAGASSLSQPFFGWVADRYGPRVLRFSLLWTAVVFAAIGFASSFGTLVALAAAAGLGSGAYHPFGAVGVRAVAPEQRRGTATSVYVTGGYLGVALGPLIGATLLSASAAWRSPFCPVSRRDYGCYASSARYRARRARVRGQTRSRLDMRTQTQAYLGSP